MLEQQVRGVGKSRFLRPTNCYRDYLQPLSLLCHGVILMSTARWSLLSKVALKARSSHSLSITHDGLLLLYGGELEPRKPVDTAANSTANHESLVVTGAVHSYDLKNAENANHPWLILTPNLNSVVVPEPRVGATTVWDTAAQSLYLWGGRGGVDMAPLDRVQAGLWKGHIITTPSGSIQWERLIASNEDDAPEPRSYHTSVSFEVRMLRYSAISGQDILENRAKFTFMLDVLPRAV